MAALGPLACRRAEAPAAKESIETVDVGESIDSRIRPQDDERAQVEDQGLVGVLPGDFPKDLWAYQPASIIDLGTASSGRSYVALRTVATPDEVSGRLRTEQQRRGWQVKVVAPTVLTFAKDGRLVEAQLEQRGNETWIRIEYPVS